MPESPPLTRAQVRRIDALAIEKYGIPGIVLMENAARAAAAEALELLRSLSSASAPSAAILCGGGNNGGDGFAIARHLHNAGIQTAIFHLADPANLKADAAINFEILKNMNLPRYELRDELRFDCAQTEWRKADLIVDAILGTGFSGPLRSNLARAIESINTIHREGKRVLAVDIPSGLDCDTGIPSNPTIRADVTVTFVAPKIGFKNPAAQEYLGRVFVAGIGAPPELVQEVLAGG